MNLLMEELKVSQLMNATITDTNNNTTGYIALEDARRCLFAVDVACASGMVKSKSVKVELLKAKTAIGGSSAAMTGANGVAINALQGSTTVKTDVEGMQVTDKLEVNGIEFFRAASKDVADREFSTAAELVELIEVYLPSLAASANSHVVTVTAAKEGGATVDLVETKVLTTGTPWSPGGITTAARALVEVDSEKLGAGFTHVAIKITNSAGQNIVATVQAIRGDVSYKPVYQAVANKANV